MTMVLYWKQLTVLTNSLIIDVTRNPGFTSALLLLLRIIQFVSKYLFFFPYYTDDFQLANKINYFLYIIVESRFIFLLSR